jgi:NAD(P)-dependent dehydrogenase (short-subunit alcohol dehydrogenase family)
MEHIMPAKVVVVTGASGALGAAVVAAVRAQGGRIGAIDHAATTRPATPEHLALGGVDLSDPAQARTAIETAAAHFGQLDALINVAGAFAYETIADGEPSTWQRLYAVNVLTALHASRAAIPHLLKSSAGRIVNIGAMGALRAGAGMGPYAASKAGVHRLTEALAAEFKGQLTVNAVLPSTIDTPANRKSMPDANFNDWVTLDELAAVILFLASYATSGFTGALLPVTGRV